MSEAAPDVLAPAKLGPVTLRNRIKADATVTSQCVHCNRCIPTIYSRARCVLVDPLP